MVKGEKLMDDSRMSVLVLKKQGLSNRKIASMIGCSEEGHNAANFEEEKEETLDP